MKDAGYYTGDIGKWHLGETTEYPTNNIGFDYFYCFLGGGHEYFTDTWISKSTFNPLSYSAGNYTGEYKSPLMLNKDYVDTTSGLYCTDVEVPDTPEPSREPTGREGRDDDYMCMSSVGRKKEAIGGSFMDRLFGMEEGDNKHSETNGERELDNVGHV